VGLPENFAFMGDDERRLELASSLAERAQRFLVTMARRYQVTLLGGGYPVPAGERLTSNRAELVGKDGAGASLGKWREHRICPLKLPMAWE
jgi:nitrilase